MLAFIGVHNFSPRTAAETVRTFSRSAVAEPAPEPVPVAVVSPEIANAFGLTENPAVIVATAPEKPANRGKNANAKPEPAPAVSTCATVDRRRFLADCRQAKTHCGRCTRSAVVLRIESGSVRLESRNDDSVFFQHVAHTYNNATEPAAAVVDASKMVTLLAKITADDIGLTIRTENGAEPFALVITADGAEFDILASAPDDDIESRFSEFAKPFGATFAHATTAGELRNAFERCSVSMDSETTRYALGGILFSPAADSIEFASTDSRRLTVRRISAELSGELETDRTYAAVIPAGAVRQIVDGLQRVPDSAAVSIAADFVMGNALDVVVECAERFAIRTRSLDGRFPRYNDIIPKTFAVTLSADRKRLISAIKSAAVVLSKDSRGMVFRWRPDGSGELRGESTETGRSRIPFAWQIESGDFAELVRNQLRENHSEIESAYSRGVPGTPKPAERPADDFRAEAVSILGTRPTEITFDPVYVLSYLEETESERVELKLYHLDKAAAFVDVDSPDAGIFVVMPLAQE